MLNYIKAGMIILLFSIIYFYENIKMFTIEKVYPFIFKYQESIMLGSSTAFFAAILTLFPFELALIVMVILFTILLRKPKSERTIINIPFFIAYICTALICGLINIVFNKLIVLNVVICYLILLFLLYCIKTIRLSVCR